ncbi:MAG TPA: hypothetical protein VGC88_08570 [Terriglobales bacterium]
MRIVYQLAFAATATVVLGASGVGQLREQNPTKYLDCAADASGNNTRAQKIRTPEFSSKSGVRAFAVVSTDTANECLAQASVYVAEPAQNFRLLKRVDHYVAQGVGRGTGVDGIFWSPSGRYLAVDFTHWSMGSDASFDDELFVYNFVSKREVKLRLSTEEQGKQVFADCDGELALSGWVDERHLRLRADRVPYIDEERPEVLKVCNGKPFELSYDIATGNIAALKPKAGK